VNSVYVKYKSVNFFSIHLRLIKWDYFAKMLYILYIIIYTINIIYICYYLHHVSRSLTRKGYYFRFCRPVKLIFLKGSVLQNILKKSVVTFFQNISSNINYFIFVRNKKNLHIFTFLLWKRTIRFLRSGYKCIPTIHNGYCVSNAVDYGKKNDVYPTLCSLD